MQTKYFQSTVKKIQIVFSSTLVGLNYVKL